VIRDVLAAVQKIALAKFSCGTIEAAEAKTLPKDYKPRSGRRPEGISPTEYERWIVTLCGRREQFLIALWRMPPTPGVVFRVGFPFPEAANR
jgi:hypothetical protein